MDQTQNSSRIGILDSFRFLAITGVILFHYFTRWNSRYNTPSLYSYDRKYDFFEYGHFGVEFFFIISGFVIAFTLEKTNSIKSFWKKRLTRLFPAMLLCSIVTFCACKLLDNNILFPESHKPVNILYSITFINPAVLDIFLNKFSISGMYIDKSYWSLWPEIQFYFLASITYYLNPKKFLQVFFILSIFFYAFNWVINVAGADSFNLVYVLLRKFMYMFNIFKFILWFFIGILFYQFYKKKSNVSTIISMIVVCCLQAYSCKILAVQLIFVLFLLFFFSFIYFPNMLKFLDNKLFKTIGVSSYTLYLIHGNIGVVLINKYSKYLGKFDFILPLLLMIIFIVFSVASYRYFEKPIIKFLNKANH